MRAFKLLRATFLVCLFGTSTPSQALKLDCFPLDGASKETCEARGCIWSPVHEKSPPVISKYAQQLPFTDVNFNIGPRSRVEEPWCYFPDDYVGYKISKTSSTGDKIELVRVRPSGLPDDIRDLVVEIQEHDTVLRIKISDADSRRFVPELPVLELSDPKPVKDISFSVRNDSHLVVKRSSTGAVLFDTDLSKLIYSDKFIQLNSKLSSPLVYGLGEHYDTFLKLADRYKTYSFWHTDKTPPPGGARTYGSFPFYVNFDSDKKHAHGVYLRNSNAMDIVLQPDPSVTFRPIGGIIDILLFTGPKPNDVIVQYQQAVGLPQMPPRWALGFHLCRYNYNSLEKTRLVWQRTRDAGIPFDVQWNDIDYMNRHNDFTYDHDKYAGLPEFVEELHKANMHYVILFDPGLSQDVNFKPYTIGEQMDIFIKNATNQTLVGKVWNDSGRTVFPDFSNVKAHEFWKQMFVQFQQELKYDGAWIDMNDISNFVDGSLEGCCWDSPLEKTLYNPGGYKLQTKTLCLSARHKGGLEYDMHNLYSFYESIATEKAMRAARPNKRPLIISRSTAPGQGHFSGHWSGDVLSNWDYLKWSIPSTIEHSMYGYSLIGTDICGFIGNTTPQLCARWSTLGAFYTFTRNHNDDVSIDQDPVALGPEVVEANRNAMTKRYAMLPYLYSLIYRAHLYGEPVVRSVPLEFYESDPETLKVEYQFMWGKALMISPIVDKDTYEKSTYLPKGRWYETGILPSTQGQNKKAPRMIDSKGEWYKTHNISLTDIPLFYRGGHIIPVYTDVQPTVPETVVQSIALQISLCEMRRAHGELFLDDGENLDSKHNHLTMSFVNNSLVINMDLDDYSDSVTFGKVTVLGADPGIAEASLNGEILPIKRNGHMIEFDLKGSKVSKSRDIAVNFSTNMAQDRQDLRK